MTPVSVSRVMLTWRRGAVGGRSGERRRTVLRLSRGRRARGAVGEREEVADGEVWAGGWHGLPVALVEVGVLVAVEDPEDRLGDDAPAHGPEGQAVGELLGLGQDVVPQRRLLVPWRFGQAEVAVFE